MEFSSAVLDMKEICAKYKDEETSCRGCPFSKGRIDCILTDIINYSEAIERVCWEWEKNAKGEP